MDARGMSPKEKKYCLSKNFQDFKFHSDGTSLCPQRRSNAFIFPIYIKLSFTYIHTIRVDN